MPTNRKPESRHRWTPKEENLLRDLSKPFSKAADAVDAAYVALGMPRSAVAAKLYELRLKGLTPWLDAEGKARTTDEVGPAFLAAVREMARCMRTEGITDCMLEVKETVKVTFVRKATSLDLEFK